MEKNKIFPTLFIILILLSVFVSNLMVINSLQRQNVGKNHTISRIDKIISQNCLNFTDCAAQLNISCVSNLTSSVFSLSCVELSELLIQEPELQNIVQFSIELGYITCLGRYLIEIDDSYIFIGLRGNSDNNSFVAVISGLRSLSPENSSANHLTYLINVSGNSLMLFDREIEATLEFNNDSINIVSTAHSPDWYSDLSDLIWCVVQCMISPGSLATIGCAITLIPCFIEDDFCLLTLLFCGLALVECILSCIFYPHQYDAPPEPSIIVSTSQGVVGQEIFFDGTDSTDPNDFNWAGVYYRDIVYYLWDFGDGSYASGPAVSHVYNSPGNYIVTLTAYDSLGISASISVPLQILDAFVDDDISPPIIIITYIGDFTDGDPGYWAVSTSDLSNIASMEVLIDSQSIGNSNGNYNVPNIIGSHTIVVKATDADDTPLTAVGTHSLELVDDDTIAPFIQLNYLVGDGTDGNPGIFSWVISDTDSGIGGDGDTGLSSIEIKVKYISFDGSSNFELTLPSNASGSWALSPNLGDYYMNITAIDNDDDRTLLFDNLISIASINQSIIDDDETPPESYGLTISDDIYSIVISFNASDNSGIASFDFTVEGIQATPISQSQIGDIYLFELKNNWIMEVGIHQLRIELTDADDDRFNDSLTTVIEESFEVTLDKMKQYVNWEISQLNKNVQESLNECWSEPMSNRKFVMNNKLIELMELIDSNLFGEAYDKLLHDIKPKLTGFKTNEIEISWGNGVFNNSWVSCRGLQEVYQQICNKILILITTLSKILE